MDLSPTEVAELRIVRQLSQKGVLADHGKGPPLTERELARIQRWQKKSDEHHRRAVMHRATKAELAWCHDTTSRQITDWTAQGMPVNADGSYNVHDAGRWIKNARFTHCPQTQLAKAFDIGTRMVRKLTEAGMPRNPDGTYNVPNAFAWRLSEAERRADALPTSSKRTPEQRRMDAAEAEIREHKLGVLKRQYIRTDESEDQCRRCGGNIRQSLLHHPARMALVLVNRTAAEIKDELLKEVELILRHLYAPDGQEKGS